MPEDLTRYVLDLEGRVTALSGILGLLIWVLRERGVMDEDLERRIYCSTSDAVTAAPAEIEAAADRLILALQGATAMMSPPLSPDQA